MSISSEITRITAARDLAIRLCEEKGATLTGNEILEDLIGLIAQLGDSATGLDLYVDGEGTIVLDGDVRFSGVDAQNSDWEFVDSVTTQEELTSLRITSDFSKYKKVMVQAMIQPHSTQTTSFAIRAGFSNSPNCNPWSINSSMLANSGKNTDKTSFGMIEFEVDNLGIHSTVYRSDNSTSVSATLSLKGTGYSDRIASPFKNGVALQSNQILDDFDLITMSPEVVFPDNLDIGSYQNCIGIGSIFKVWGKR